MLFDQLPPQSFYKLITNKTEFDEHDILSNLGSISSIPDDTNGCINKIHIYHHTFRDFMLSKVQCRCEDERNGHACECIDERFHVDQREARENALKSCLILLQKVLKRDIPKSDDSKFRPRGAKYPRDRDAFLPEIEYACLY